MHRFSLTAWFANLGIAISGTIIDEISSMLTALAALLSIVFGSIYFFWKCKDRKNKNDEK